MGIRFSIEEIAVGHYSVKDSVFTHGGEIYGIGKKGVDGTNSIIHNLAGNKVPYAGALTRFVRTTDHAFFVSENNDLVDPRNGENVFRGDSNRSIEHVFEHERTLFVSTLNEQTGTRSLESFSSSDDRSTVCEVRNSAKSRMVFHDADCYVQVADHEWVSMRKDEAVEVPKTGELAGIVENSSCVVHESDAGYHVIGLEDGKEVALFDFLPEWAARFPGKPTKFFGYAIMMHHVLPQFLSTKQLDAHTSRLSEYHPKHVSGAAVAPILELVGQSPNSDPDFIDIGERIALHTSRLTEDRYGKVYHVISGNKFYELRPDHLPRSFAAPSEYEVGLLAAVETVTLGNGRGQLVGKAVPIALYESGYLGCPDNPFAAVDKNDCFEVIRNSNHQREKHDFRTDFFAAVGDKIYCLKDQGNMLYEITVKSTPGDRPPDTFSFAGRM